jgi:hypothetical protein
MTQTATNIPNSLQHWNARTRRVQELAALVRKHSTDSTTPDCTIRNRLQHLAHAVAASGTVLTELQELTGTLDADELLTLRVSDTVTAAVVWQATCHVIRTVDHITNAARPFQDDVPHNDFNSSPKLQDRVVCV